MNDNRFWCFIIYLWPARPNFCDLFSTVSCLLCLGADFFVPSSGCQWKSACTQAYFAEESLDSLPLFDLRFSPFKMSEWVMMIKMSLHSIFVLPQNVRICGATRRRGRFFGTDLHFLMSCQLYLRLFLFKFLARRLPQSGKMGIVLQF